MAESFQLSWRDRKQTHPNVIHPHQQRKVRGCALRVDQERFEAAELGITINDLHQRNFRRVMRDPFW